jgi:hypothetical protein
MGIKDFFSFLLENEDPYRKCDRCPKVDNLYKVKKQYLCFDCIMNLFKAGIVDKKTYDEIRQKHIYHLFEKMDEKKSFYSLPILLFEKKLFFQFLLFFVFLEITFFVKDKIDCFLDNCLN